MTMESLLSMEPQQLTNPTNSRDDSLPVFTTGPLPSQYREGDHSCIPGLTVDLPRQCGQLASDSFDSTSLNILQRSYCMAFSGSGST